MNTPPSDSNQGAPVTAGGLDMTMPSESAKAPQDSVTPPTSGNASGPTKKTWRQKLLRGSLLLVALLLVAFFVYRWAGTRTYLGTVQRVYEKQAEYRVEFADQDGEVRVVGNEEIRFPYFKTATADLHAELNRLSLTKDLVKIKVWGFRQSLFSMFPNVIDVEFVQSQKERVRERAGRLADAVLATLANRDALKKDDPATRDAVVEAIMQVNAQAPAQVDE